MCSPSGLSYIGRSKQHLGEIPAAIACKRIHLDNAIAMAAKRLMYKLKWNTYLMTIMCPLFFTLLGPDEEGH